MSTVFQYITVYTSYFPLKIGCLSIALAGGGTGDLTAS